ncbi:MAG: hypothetical protein MO852_15000, partial [Candidatus Devosia euplotis]|nr:hypothetical protein [Candidatus Devosia euplotis]
MRAGRGGVLTSVAELPPVITDWFARKGCAPRQHQLDVLGSCNAGASALLIAPTGAGKTPAGF